jgi:predicted nucleic acid-binding protein
MCRHRGTNKQPSRGRVLGWAVCFTVVYPGYFLGWLNHGKLQSTDSPTDSKNWWDMQRVYLDTSVYNRPFDDQSQPRIWLETLACSLILQMIEEERILLVTSSVVGYENNRNPFSERQTWVKQIMTMAAHYQQVNESIRERARILEDEGVKALDALHLACAESTRSNAFVTCDDRLLRRYRSLDSAVMSIYEPTEFVRLFDTEGQEER